MRLVDVEHAGALAARLAHCPAGDMQATGAAAMDFVCEHMARLYVSLVTPGANTLDHKAREAARGALFAALQRWLPYFVTGAPKDTTYLLMLWVAFQAGDNTFLEKLLTFVPPFVGARTVRGAIAPPSASEALPADFALSATSHRERRFFFADATLEQITARRHLPSIDSWCAIVPPEQRSGEFVAHCMQTLIDNDWTDALRVVVHHFGDLDLCAYNSRHGPLHSIAEASPRISEHRLLRMAKILLDAGADPSQSMSTEFSQTSNSPPVLVPPLYAALLRGRPQLAALYYEASQTRLDDERRVARHLKRVGAIARGFPLSFETLMLLMAYLRHPAQSDIVAPISALLARDPNLPADYAAPDDVFLLIQGTLLVADQFVEADEADEADEAARILTLQPNTIRDLKWRLWKLLAPHLTVDNSRLEAFLHAPQQTLSGTSTALKPGFNSIFAALKMGYLDLTCNIPEMFAVFVSVASRSVFFKALQCNALFEPWEQYAALFTVLLRVRRLEHSVIRAYHIEGMLQHAQGPCEIAAALRANIMLGDNSVQNAILRHAQTHRIAFWTATREAQTAFLLAETPPDGWDYTPIIKSMPADAFVGLMRQQDASGQTPLHLAAGRSAKSLKTLLLALGANMSAELMQQDYFGRTPLQEALVRGQPLCFSLLWRALSKQGALDVVLSQALSVAVKRGYAHMVDAIGALDGGDAFLQRQRPKLMQAALLRGDCASLKRLVRQFGFAHTAFTEQPYRLLHDLARGGSVSCLEFVRQHLGTAALTACAEWQAIDGKRAEDVCRAPALQVRLHALRGITRQGVGGLCLALSAMETLISQLSTTLEQATLESGAIEFMKHALSLMHDPNKRRENEHLHGLDLAWQLASLLERHSAAGMGHHFEEHAPSMSLAALRARIDQGQKWGASQFSLSCIISLLQMRTRIMQAHDQDATSVGVQTRNISDAGFCGQGFARDDKGGEPYLFRGSTTVRFVYLCKPEGVQFVSIYPIPSDT